MFENIKMNVGNVFQHRKTIDYKVDVSVGQGEL